MHHNQANKRQHSKNRVFPSEAIILNKKASIVRHLFYRQVEAVSSLSEYKATCLRPMLAVTMTTSVLRSGITSTSGRTGHESAQSFGSFCAACPPLRAPSAHSWAGPAHAARLQFTSTEPQKTRRWRDRGQPTSSKLVSSALTILPRRS